MSKKIIILIAVFAVAAAFTVSTFSRKAPDLLRHAIEGALDKKVLIGSIEYRFPGTFRLKKFEIQEKGRFEGETSFSAEEISLFVSPLSLSSRKLLIDRMEVESAQVVIRKFRGKLVHSLSDAIQRSKAAGEASGQTAGVSRPSSALPLQIEFFILKKSFFKFIDYDVQEDGFVILLDEIDASIKNIRLPLSSGKTSYKFSARMPQGREQLPAEFKGQGWTTFGNMDTDANFSITRIYLPYYKPYYSQVTGASLSDGFLDSRLNVRMDKKDLALNADLEIIGLLFEGYEGENELFGLKADELLSFMKDRSGKLKFQFTARWNTADRSVRPRDVIRKSIEKSLKNMIIGNLGNVLESALQKVGEQSSLTTKEDLESKIKKIKDIFRY